MGGEGLNACNLSLADCSLGVLTGTRAFGEACAMASRMLLV